jgi:cAMP-dependent protein kinase regulator
MQSVFADAVLFRDLTAAERDAICSVMVPEIFGAGEVIIAQGDQGDKFYVLESGTCVIRKVLGKKAGPDDFGAEVMRLDDTGSFGELALMYGSPRAASVIAETKVKVWSIDRSTYRTCLMQHTMSKRARYCDFLRKVPLLAELEPYQIVIVADAMTTFNFPAGRAIVHEGEEGDYFYIIEEGRCSVSKSDPASGLQYAVGELAVGAYFGEVALLTDAPRQATVTALTDVRCVGLDRARFSRVLGPCEELLRSKMADYNLPEETGEAGKRVTHLDDE